MSAGDVLVHIFLPLLTQETAVMISTFTYGIKAGLSSAILVIVNTGAVIVDLGLFFVPVYFLSGRLHRMLISRFQDHYETGVRYMSRFGAFRTSAVLGFVMPSVAAMIVIGLLRLSFWRSLGGLFVGSAVYVVLPLVVALPLASTLPSFVAPLLQWAAPTVFALYLLIALVRWRLGRSRPSRDEATEKG